MCLNLFVHFVDSIMDELILMDRSVAMAFDWLSVNQVNHPFNHIYLILIQFMAASFDVCCGPCSFNVQGGRVSGECWLRRSEPPPLLFSPK